MLIGMTQPNTPTDAERICAILSSHAQAIRIGMVPAPNSITVWTHNVSAAELLKHADRNALPITIMEAEERGFKGHALIKITPGADLLPASVYYFEHTVASWDLSDKARAEYAAHNADCVGDFDVEAVN